jgi:hypothetical protein
MPTFKFNTVERNPSTLGLWIRINADEYRCGNVAVKRCDYKGDPTGRWFIFLRSPRAKRRRTAKYKLFLPKTRTYGYGHPSQAKIGAAMAARWQAVKHK